MKLLYQGLAMAMLASIAGVTPIPAQTPATRSAGPSFACAPGQGVIETTVCSSPSLSAADRVMATLYAADRVSAFGTGPSNVQIGQRKALKDMQDCARASGRMSVADCLKASYDQRNAELAVAAVIRAPDLALPVLRKVDPTFAPVAEAIGIWASEPRDANWSAPSRAAKRSRIAALLAPVMTDLQTRSDAAFARSILANPAGDGVTVTRVDDLFTSERHFADFLGVLGAVLPDSDNMTGRAVPCAAIVRHPKLLDATRSFFGATLDRTVFNTDCAETLPPAPALTELDGKLRKGWPACEGTIRFAAYRTYQVGLDSARLGFARHDPKAALPRRRDVTNADVAAARNELAAYYARYLAKARPEAEAMASDAIRAVMNAAQECE